MRRRAAFWGWFFGFFFLLLLSPVVSYVMETNRLSMQGGCVCGLQTAAGAQSGGRVSSTRRGSTRMGSTSMSSTDATRSRAHTARPPRTPRTALNTPRAPLRRHVTGEATAGAAPHWSAGCWLAIGWRRFPPPVSRPPFPREGGESRDFREPVRKGHKQNKPRSRMEGPGRSGRGGAPC